MTRPMLTDGAAYKIGSPGSEEFGNDKNFYLYDLILVLHVSKD